MKEWQKKERDQAKQGEQISLMQQMAEVIERNYLDSWPETMQEGDRDQTATAEAYGMITRKSKDEVEELNL